MIRIYVGVGSNINPATHIKAGLNQLNALHPIVAASPFYETPAIGRPEQENYWNGIVAVDVPDNTDPVQFQLETLRSIEAHQGRIRSADKYAARTLDLDIVLWGDLELDQPGLTVPDPDIATRPFLVRCLLDLNPTIQVPGHDQPLQPPEATPHLIGHPWP